MADAALQLQEAIAAGHSDPAVLTVIAQTAAFFSNGSAPVKGLDEIDRLLMRKRHMLKMCGPAESHRIDAYSFSDALLCAVRVTVMNESDVDVLCPRATGPWHDHNCDSVPGGGRFDPARAVSPQNERAMIAALRGSVQALLDEAPTTVEEDEALLALSSLQPALRSAITLRLREKQLLQRALKNTDDLETELERLERLAEDEDRREQQRLRERMEAGAADAIYGGGGDGGGNGGADGGAGAGASGGGAVGDGRGSSRRNGSSGSSSSRGEDSEDDDDGFGGDMSEDFDEDWEFMEDVVGASESEQALKKARIKEEASSIHYFQLWVRERERAAHQRRRAERERCVRARARASACLCCVCVFVCLCLCLYVCVCICGWACRVVDRVQEQVDQRTGHTHTRTPHTRTHALQPHTPTTPTKLQSLALRRCVAAAGVACAQSMRSTMQRNAA
jgi:hypothetical protein